MNIRTDIIDSTIDDRYYIKHFLGEGGFGMVFNAEHRIFDTFFRNVALKVFKEGKVTTETAKETFNDAIILAKIIDQNRDREGCRYLVHVFDIGILKDLDYRGYVSMEYIPGGDLHNYMKQRHCPVPIDSALNYMEQICKGLSVLHCQDNPFIHRDLKLANLLFTDSKKGQIKIVDFGLATAVDKILGDASNAGTIHCQAPESFDNFSNDPRSDVYSLGLIFYEMLTQHHPFEEVGRHIYKENKLAYMLLQAEARKTFVKDGKPPSKFNLTVAKIGGLDDLIMKCLDFYPGNRFSDASSLLKSIEKIKNGQKQKERPKSTDETITDSITEGKFYLEKSNYEQALMILEDTYKKIISHKKEKTFPELFFTLGKAYFKTGNNIEAIKKYQEGLRIKPLGKYFNELAEIYNCIKKPNLAGIMKKKAKDFPWEG